MLYYTALYNTVPYCNLLHCIILYYTILYHTILYYTTLYYKNRVPKFHSPLSTNTSVKQSSDKIVILLGTRGCDLLEVSVCLNSSYQPRLFSSKSLTNSIKDQATGDAFVLFMCLYVSFLLSFFVVFRLSVLLFVCLFV